MALTVHQIVRVCCFFIMVVLCTVYLTNQPVITDSSVTKHEPHRGTWRIPETLDTYNGPPDNSHSDQQLSSITTKFNKKYDSSSYMHVTLAPDGMLLKRSAIPTQQIAFLKVHKCASSTIQNILMRYGYKNDLEFALPVGNRMQFDWPNLFDRRSMINSSTANILCQHTRFSEDLVRTMNRDTTYISVVRQPENQLKSAYVYYKYHRSSGMSLSDIVTYAATDESWASNFTALPLRNPVAFDFGLNSADMAQPAKVEKFLTDMNRTFHLVLVVEYFYESLIILRDTLGWTNDDIKFFTINGHVNVHRNPGYDRMSSVGVDPAQFENVKRLYRQVSPVDYQIYNMFRRRLLKIIEANRDYLNQEIIELEKLNRVWSEFCIQGSYPQFEIKDRRFLPAGGGTYGYKLTTLGLKNETCRQMAYAERVWNTILHNRQRPRG